MQRVKREGVKERLYVCSERALLLQIAWSEGRVHSVMLPTRTTASASPCSLSITKIYTLSFVHSVRLYLRIAEEFVVQRMKILAHPHFASNGEQWQWILKSRTKCFFLLFFHTFLLASLYSIFANAKEYTTFFSKRKLGFSHFRRTNAFIPAAVYCLLFSWYTLSKRHLSFG